MDPLAHTLVGASLAQTPLRRWAPLAAPALILGANAPDIDALAYFLGRDLSLGFRRGWTHGIVALGVLPVLLSAALWALARFRARLRNVEPPSGYARLLAVCAIGVWTHPLLDWLNTYGIRLWMPFSGRWFYGDTLFIIDPWLWIVAAVPLVLTASHTPRSGLAWIALGTVTTWLVVTTALVPVAARWTWIGALVALVVLRTWNGFRDRAASVAAGALACLCVYILAMYAGSRSAARTADAWLAERGIVAHEVMAGPVPADPWERDIIAVVDGAYHFLTVRLGGAATVRERAPVLPMGPRNPIVEAALSAPHVQGLRTWLRYPAFRVVPRENGHRVEILDARHVGRGMLGRAVVDLDGDLTPLPPGATTPSEP